LVGPLFTDFTARSIGNAGILFVGAALFVLAVVLQAILIRLWKSGPEPRQDGGETDHQTRDRALGGNPFAGITLVLRSPYLLGIAAYVALLATANTFLYFEQLRLVATTFADTQTRTSVFARIDWIVQSLTILAQLFITGRIASRFGLVVLLTIIPVAVFFGFVALAIWNTFAVLAVVIVLRRSGEYAFVRPGREMLWTPMSKETKYKAKNFVDVPVYRGADAAVAQLQRAIEGAGLGASTAALLGALGAIVWAANGWWLGRRHDAAARGAIGDVAAPDQLELHSRSSRAKHND
ncbi:MAG: NTP/NDP exchange transporter, partial [Gammaproteobacteria bacterium]